MKLTLGILKTDDVLSELAADYGEYPLMFERLLQVANTDPQLQLEFVTYQVNKGIYPAELDEVDAFLMTGSKSSVYAQIPWITKLTEFVRTLHRHKKKFIGICFGHQMVAHALGGKTCLAESGWSLGAKQAKLNPDAEPNIFAGKSFNLIYSHQDQIVVPAPGTEILASTDTCPIAATGLDKHILTFQGHPEFFSDFSRALFQLRRAGYPPKIYEAAMASLEQTADQYRVAKLMIDFCLASQ